MTNLVAKEVRVRGVVQGVGFRPAVWHLAQNNQLVGDVCNDGEGVLIRIVGTARHVDNFLQRLPNEVPRLSHVDSIEVRPLSAVVHFHGFDITQSRRTGNHIQVTADAALCEDCRAECLASGARRFYYPFTNCTFCGPRFSIVHGVPYDRENTTMAAFRLCEACADEYHSPLDRRFHAQPIACPDCGPRIWLEYNGYKDSILFNNKEVIEQAVTGLRQGKILAIRGLGGFHLACDATNAQVVNRLRARKRRNAKPFALMARDLATIENYCITSEQERELLQSPEAPIVLLTAKNPGKLPASISPDTRLLGFMLPYTPLHLLLMLEFDGPLVMTSGNLSDEPQIVELDKARTSLADIADIFLLHDRGIANRIDDSVVRVAAGRPQIIRRARGYAPRAIKLPAGFGDVPGILAFGGELKSTFCLVKDGAAILSQHQGDLEDAATFDDYEKNLELYQQLFDHHPLCFAADQHPEYLSTKLAHSVAQENKLPLFTVQHHHAHIASCLAENGVAMDAPPVLGIVMDGLGYGEDHSLWGGEFLLADYRTSRRLAGFTPIAMIGGFQAIKEPWRNTYSYLIHSMGWQAFSENFGETDLYHYLAGKPLAMLDKMLLKKISAPLASSCGRLFDAVAAALNLCRDHAYFEGQGAIALESLVDPLLLRDLLIHPEPAYTFQLLPDGTSAELLRLDATRLWQALLLDMQQNIPPAVIATRFHAGLARGLIATVNHLARALKIQGRGFDSVALSGGCFQNKVLLESCVTLLQQEGYRCLWQSQVPANDGGLALGQAAVAAARYLALNKADLNTTIKGALCV
jgi:hydrogenase maturation protein HypF